MGVNEKLKFCSIFAEARRSKSTSFTPNSKKQSRIKTKTFVFFATKKLTKFQEKRRFIAFLFYFQRWDDDNIKSNVTKPTWFPETNFLFLEIQKIFQKNIPLSIIVNKKKTEDKKKLPHNQFLIVNECVFHANSLSILCVYFLQTKKPWGSTFL